MRPVALPSNWIDYIFLFVLSMNVYFIPSKVLGNYNKHGHMMDVKCAVNVISCWLYDESDRV